MSTRTEQSSPTNWGGNHTYRTARVARPTSIEELTAAVFGAPRVRALGSRHSFNDIADSELLVDTSALPVRVALDTSSRTVTVSGNARYGELAAALHERGWALHNLASLPHISIAGAIATATHGSGDRNGNLATAVRSLRLLTAAGEIVDVERGDRRFPGVVVGLGTLGVVLDVTLEIEPSFDVRQRLFAGLPWREIACDLDAITGSAYSVSLFTNWQ